MAMSDHDSPRAAPSSVKATPPSQGLDGLDDVANLRVRVGEEQRHDVVGFGGLRPPTLTSRGYTAVAPTTTAR